MPAGVSASGPPSTPEGHHLYRPGMRLPPPEQILKLGSSIAGEALLSAHPGHRFVAERASGSGAPLPDL